VRDQFHTHTKPQAALTLRLRFNEIGQLFETRIRLTLK
jgi:hypothetical protein